MLQDIFSPTRVTATVGGKEIIFRVEKGKYQFGFNFGSNQVASMAIPDEDFGAWVTLVGVYDGRLLHLYRNGTVIAQTTPAQRPVDYEGDWAVGYNPAFPNRQFLGEIGQTMGWQRALSAREVAVATALAETDDVVIEAFETVSTLSQGLVRQETDTLEVSANEGGLLLGNTDFLDETQPYTVSAVICPDIAMKTSGGDHTIVSKGHVGGKEVIFRIEKGKYQFGFNNSGNRIVSVAVPEEDFGNWVTLTGTVEGRTIRLYRNGSLLAQKTVMVAPAAYTAAWAIGYNPTVAGRRFIGKIRDVAVWARALSAEECWRLGMLSHEAFAALPPASPAPLPAAYSGKTKRPRIQAAAKHPATENVLMHAAYSPRFLSWLIR